MTRRWAALGGVAGPAAFVTAWSVLGTRLPGYGPVDDPISRLAAVGASTRVPMTAGFVAFGVGVSLYSGALRRELPGGAAAAAATTAIATVGVGLLPLGSSLGDAPHAAAAGTAYAALAATPLLAARALAHGGSRRAAFASAAAGVVVAGALAASAVADTRVGLLQRVGLTVGDVWIVASAVWLLRRTASTARARP